MPGAMKKPMPKKLMAPSKPRNTKVPMPKIQGAKPGARKLLPKNPNAAPTARRLMAKPLTGPAAVEALQRRVSPAGVKKAESGAKKAINKKYPGLYKKSK